MKKMSKKLGLVLSAALIATTVMTGCNEKSGDAATKPAAAAKTEKKAELFADWKPAEVLDKLQGTFKVGSASWEVKGDKVTITSNGNSKEATLDVNNPCALKVVVTNNGGSSWDNYGIAINGDDVYIGLGTYGMKFGDTYMVNKDGVVLFDGTTCNYYKEKRFGEKGYEAPVSVKGEVSEKDGKSVFTFDVPSRFKEGDFKNYSVEVVGTALLNGQAKSNLIKK